MRKLILMIVPLALIVGCVRHPDGTTGPPPIEAQICYEVGGVPL